MKNERNGNFGGDHGNYEHCFFNCKSCTIAMASGTGVMMFGSMWEQDVLLLQASMLRNGLKEVLRLTRF
jgi:hypothetical protein